MTGDASPRGIDFDRSTKAGTVNPGDTRSLSEVVTAARVVTSLNEGRDRESRRHRRRGTSLKHGYQAVQRSTKAGTVNPGDTRSLCKRW